MNREFVAAAIGGICSGVYGQLTSLGGPFTPDMIAGAAVAIAEAAEKRVRDIEALDTPPTTPTLPCGSGIIYNPLAALPGDLIAGPDGEVTK